MTNQTSPSKGKTRTQIAATAREREAKALKLRILGYSYESVATELGFAHRSAARKSVQRALDAIPREAATELRELEFERLDMMQRALASAVVKGHLGAIDRMLRIMDMRAKLAGLYTEQHDTGIAEVKVVLAAFMSAAVAEEFDDEDEALDDDLSVASGAGEPTPALDEGSASPSNLALRARETGEGTP
ncbi:hypothetical protein ACGGZK_14725 [Agromyces sp. MMS24-K17]|uniref:hypothetical protein n=1 Tax=Agromyces sp. MMS24-K17 TaxID=3372850 RepID=UPI00375464B1